MAVPWSVWEFFQRSSVTPSSLRPLDLQGLEETKGTQHDVGRVELLMLKVRVEAWDSCRYGGGAAGAHMVHMTVVQMRMGPNTF